MKVIILAGGLGTRLSEYTELIPKPMVSIGSRPILWHIMKHYSSFGHKDFFIALGYKSEIIKEYFFNYSILNSDFSINLKTGKITNEKSENVDWNVNLIDTGQNSLTGGRVKRLKNFIGNETCLLTYGDGLSDINISKLIEFHKDHKKLVTVSAVRPPARFGQLEIKNNLVESFKEKPQINEGWINGGFFVIEPKFFDYIDNDNTSLEKEPLEKVANEGELMAYKHEGFWQCVDTKRDYEFLHALWEKGAPWNFK